jgi:hypothetical protein
MTSSFLSSLRQAATELEANPADASPLRRIQRECDEVQYHAEQRDSRFVAFFLSVFIADFFYNLTGDVPYSERLNLIQNRAIAIVGKQINRLATAGEHTDLPEMYGACRELSISYLDLIAEARNLDGELGR